jgi:hypothetical protein
MSRGAMLTRMREHVNLVFIFKVWPRDARPCYPSAKIDTRLNGLGARGAPYKSTVYFQAKSPAFTLGR